MGAQAESVGEKRSREAPAPRVALSPFAGAETRGLEQEADLAAEHAISFQRGRGIEGGPPPLLPSTQSLGVQAKCGCSGPCDCAEADGLQRWPDVAGAVGAATQIVGAALSPTIVDDDAMDTTAGQIRRSQFITMARAAIVSAADEELAPVGRSTANCPYIEYWWGRFRGYSAARMERAVILFASPGARTPQAYLAAMAAGARERVRRWIASGSATAPDDIDTLSAIGSGSGEAASAQAKTEPGAARSSRSVPDEILSRLGAGRSFDGPERSRMERGFGRGFTDVRIHTDSVASDIAAQHGALALTIGSNVLFRQGQYRPGSTSGDVLLAHELAHTIQQRGGGVLGGGHEGHESDADHAAVNAVAAARGYGRTAAVGGSTGVSVQACNPTVKRCPPGMQWGNVAQQSGTVGAGSLGCACTYRCVPQTYYPQETSICPADGCRRINYEIVDENYEFRVDGEVQRVPVASRASTDDTAHGWGGASTPLGYDAACLCGGVNIEGDQTGQREAVSITPIAVDATDVVGPLADVAAARSQTNRTTGVRQPDDSTPTPRRTDPMTPPPEHVGAPPVRDQQPGGMATTPRVGVPDPLNPNPHVQQLESNWCGAACGEMAARGLGVEVNQSTIAGTPHFMPRYEVSGQVIHEGGFQTQGLVRALTEVAPVPGRVWRGGDLPHDVRTADGLRTNLSGYLESTGTSIILRVGLGDHWIIVDRVMPDGRIAIRDPSEHRSSLVTGEQLAGMSPTNEAVLSFPRSP